MPNDTSSLSSLPTGIAKSTAGDSAQNSSFYARFGKRLFDIIFSAVVLISIAPIILVMAVMNWREGGPAFFSQARVGINRRSFNCHKIRTMVVDADDRLEELFAQNEEAREQWIKYFKIDNDPRITKVGQFLRRTSLDELPQFWNVFVGEMSVVGPRPSIAREIDLYSHLEDQFEVVLSAKPGITGFWQISDRNDASYEERIAADVQYVESMSFWGDLKIIVATVTTLLKATGR